MRGAAEAAETGGSGAVDGISERKYVIFTFRRVAADIEFDWDEANIKHIARHRVSPDEAEEVLLSDPVEIDYQVADEEERFVAVGLTRTGRFLTLVWTWRGEAIRIVTAFDSPAADRSVYPAQKGL